MDIIVMLHGDGQYAPEKLPDVVAPLERGEADAVFAYQFLYELEPAQPAPVASWQSEGSYRISWASPG